MVPGDVLERLVQEDDREGDLEDDDPLGTAERSDLKYQLREREDEEDRRAKGTLIGQQTTIKEDQQSAVELLPQTESH